MSQPALKEKEISAPAGRRFEFEQIFDIPDGIYENVEVDGGEYLVMGEDGNPLGQAVVEIVFDNTFRVKGSIPYYTPDRLLLENGELKLQPQYVGFSLVNVAPVDPTKRVMTYLVKVELAGFKLVPKRF